MLRMDREPRGAAKLSALVDEAMPVFEAAGDDLALYIAYNTLSEQADLGAQMGTALEALERASDHASQAGFRSPGWFDWARAYFQ